MNLFLNIIEGAYAEFYGWDIFLYYIYAIRTFMQDYSWQVRLSYAIILACIVTMIFLMILFTHNIRKRSRYEEDYKHCINTYGEAFYTILENRTRLSEQEIFEICDVEDTDEFGYYNGLLYADIITHLRMTMNETLYMPNLQLLCELTGARDALQRQLKDRRDVLHTLQIINTLPLDIDEGLLAVYTSHNKKQIAELARITHMFVSPTEPYLYFLQDMNQPHDPWYRITIHRILGWKREQNIPMPPLKMLAHTCKNPEMAAFLVEEISYWGTDEEKSELYEYFTDERIDVRLAAIYSIARLGLSDGEQRIMEHYDDQPQVVRRAMLRALCSFKTGRYTSFFVEIFHCTPSHTSRKTALECLYEYTEESRKCFEAMYLEASDKDKILFNQIRTMHQLNEARAKASIANCKS